MATLATTSYYYLQNDTVEVTATAVDDSNEIVPPQDIVKIKVSLMKGDVVLQESDELDKFYANEDFSFKVFFAHPSSTTMLETEISVTTRDGTIIRKRTNVVPGPVSPVEGDFGDNAVNKMSV